MRRPCHPPRGRPRRRRSALAGLALAGASLLAARAEQHPPPPPVPGLAGLAGPAAGWDSHRMQHPSRGRRPDPVAADPVAPDAVAANPVAAYPMFGPGRLQTLALPARDAPHGTRRAVVYTPAVPDPDALPVLYLLHGLPGSATNLCSAATAAALDAAFASGARPFLAVCPDGATPAVPDPEWGDSADGRAGLESFVTGPLRAAVEGAHPRPAGMRAIGGFSMGGFGAASLALRHPDLYQQVVVWAGYFHLDDPDAVFGAAPATARQHSPDALGGGAAGQRWSLTEAAADPLPLTAHDAERFAPLLRTQGATVALTATPGTHSVAWAAGQLPAAAGFLSAGWTQP